MNITDRIGLGRPVVRREEVNADGDSIEDMRKVQERLGPGSVQWQQNGVGRWRNGGGPSETFCLELMMDVGHYRITAKHADEFDPKIMEGAVWFRSVLDRKMIPRCVESSAVSYFSELRGDQCIKANGSTDTLAWPLRIAFDEQECSWTAITREQYDAETAPAEQPDSARKLMATIDDARRALGMMEHGISADPEFVDAEGGDFRLKDTSPCIDAGEVIEGINDGRFEGGGPDMGAFEAK